MLSHLPWFCWNCDVNCWFVDDCVNLDCSLYLQTEYSAVTVIDVSDLQTNAIIFFHKAVKFEKYLRRGEWYHLDRGSCIWRWQGYFGCRRRTDCYTWLAYAAWFSLLITIWPFSAFECINSTVVALIIAEDACQGLISSAFDWRSLRSVNKASNSDFDGHLKNRKYYHYVTISKLKWSSHFC